MLTEKKDVQKTVLFLNIAGFEALIAFNSLGFLEEKGKL